MIPAIIHYIWLGKSEIPKIYLDCMESWKEHAVNYDCYLWNEDSYRKEFGQNDFVEEMIQRKKFAFAADLIRCDVLYRFGGIYLDTDMELVRDISALRKNIAFIGEEDIDTPSCGILGCEPKFWLFQELKAAVIKANGMQTIPFLLKNILDLHGVKKIDSQDISTIKDITIYSDKYNPYGSAKRSQLLYRYITKDCYAIHHWAKSWKLSFLERIKRKIIMRYRKE